MIDDSLIHRAKQYANACLKEGSVVPLSVATEQAVSEAESFLGFPIPELLKYCYTRIGNGGYGPAEISLIGIPCGYSCRNNGPAGSKSLYSLYTGFREHGFDAGNEQVFEYNGVLVSPWPEYLVAVFQWGSPTYLCVDFKEEGHPIYFFDAAYVDGEKPYQPCPIVRLFDSLDAFWLYEGSSSALWDSATTRLQERWKELSERYWEPFKRSQKSAARSNPLPAVRDRNGTVESILRDLEEVIVSEHPAIWKTLQPGCSEDALDHWESVLGAKLPGEFRALYRWRNGQEGTTFSVREGLFYRYRWLPIEEAIRHWEVLGGLKASGDFGEWEKWIDEEYGFEGAYRWYDELWLPFLLWEDLICIDLGGAFGGHPGQILKFLRDDEARTIEYASVANLLLTVRDVLTAKAKYETDDFYTIYRSYNAGYPLSYPDFTPVIKQYQSSLEEK